MSESFGLAALALFGLASRLLGWRPDTFWAATPAEFIAALTQPGGSASMDRQDLTKMMEQDNEAAGQ